MKFLAHFGLKSIPFHKSNIQLWDNKSLTELHNKFNRLLELPGIGILTGEYGIGKTIALKNLSSKVNPHMHKVIYISDTGFSSYEFYRILATKLEIEVSYRRIDLWVSIKEHLASLKKHKKLLPIIIIDEAQSLPHDFFENLASFLNFNYDSEDILTLWLVGNSQLLRKLKQSRYDAITSRIRIYHTLRQIENFSEFKSFIEFGLKEAGANTTLFSEAALRILKEATKDTPRKIYNVVVSCLELAYQKDLSHVTDEILTAVLEDMILT